MIWNPFKISPKGSLGIDVGTSSVKIVELSKWGKKKKLENYGEMRAEALYGKPFRTFEKSTLNVSDQDVARDISAILKEAGVKTKKAYFSIPDFSTFFTTFNLPAMTEEELFQAVKYEARQHIPLPLSEVTLDWQVIEKETANQKPTSFKILLVAVPNEVISQYQKIAKSAGLELLALEAEVFGLARASVKNQDPSLGRLKEKSVIILVDIGAQSTTISIVDGEVLKISHSFDTSGNDLTNIISKGFNVDYGKAEELKIKYGLLSSKMDIRESIIPLIDLILSEVKKVSHGFFQVEQKETQKIILAGGSALLPDLADYFSKNLNTPVEIASPFSSIYCPPVLEGTLKKMGPSYTIAVGTALKGLEQK